MLAAQSASWCHAEVSTGNASIVKQTATGLSVSIASDTRLPPHLLAQHTIGAGSADKASFAQCDLHGDAAAGCAGSCPDSCFSHLRRAIHKDLATGVAITEADAIAQALLEMAS